MNTTLRTVLALSGAVGLALDTACYMYVPAMTGPPSPGTELNSEGTTELARFLGPRVISVDGKLSSVSTDGAMVIAAASVQIADGARQPWTGNGAVVFPQVYLTSVQVRTFDRRKSTIAAVAIAASLVATGTIVMRGGSGGTTTSGNGTGVFSR